VRRALAPGGHLFIGDVRSLPLLRAFHATIERRRRPAAHTRAEARAHVAARAASEQGLLIDPLFFRSAPGRLPGVGGAAVLLKRGRRRDEQTLFRYDAILGVGQTTGPAPPAPVPAEPDLTLRRLRAMLKAKPGQALVLRDIRNARLAGPTRALAWLDGAPSSRQPASGAEGAVDPEGLCEAGEALGFAVDIGPAQSGAWDRFDALFRPQPPQGALAPYLTPAPAIGPASADQLYQYTNRPRDGSEAPALIRELRRYLALEHPALTLPEIIVLLDALPRRADGQLDMAALPRLPGASAV
jgi:hypothetical protein